jgi:hypothetical protein
MVSMAALEASAPSMVAPQATEQALPMTMTATTTASSSNATGTEFMMPTPNAGFNTPTAASSIQVSAATPTLAKNESSTVNASAKTDGYTPLELSDNEQKAVKDVCQSLPGLRGQIELFGLMNAGQSPNLGCEENFGWSDLFTAQLMKQAPANGWVGGDNATKVVVGEGPDTRFQTNYGWIYNPKTGKLWAAGFDAKDRPLVKPVGTVTAAASKDAKAEQPKAETPASNTPATAGVETDGSGK